MTFKIEEQNIIDLSLLPKDILSQIPYSIRSKKNKYKIDELPKNIQYIIKDYKSNLKTIEYNDLFDFNLYISKYGDLTKIDNYFDLVIEYLKNYLLLVKGQYPFDPLFYSHLKYYIQTKDTSLRYTLISNEIDRIVNILSQDLNIPIIVRNLDIKRSDITNSSVEYNIDIDIEVNKIIKKLHLEMV
jgi:hypothetical protein